MTLPQQLAAKLPGRFVVIDGPDGAGKGTQVRLLADALAAAAVPFVAAHDPGDTRAGDLIRHILLHSHEKLDTATEVLLFMASRAQLVAEKIRPALVAGQAVLCDRFISSTLAYQGANGADLASIIDLGRHAVGDTWPDLTIVLDIPAEEGLRRIGVARGAGAKKPAAAAQNVLFKDAVADSMESRPLAFHRRVRQIFQSLAGGDLYPTPVELVDAAADPATVHQRVVEVLARVF
ncbi:MAG: dTMP kinase [Phycisphaerae bacterium]|nr:dTMP kinase [Phycisphaerae bacterium]